MRRRLLLLALPLLAVAACRSPRPQGVPRPLAAQEGLRFTVTLESNPSTGYRWYLAAQPDPAVVKVVGSEYRKAPAAAVGAPGDEIWTFQAVSAGKATLAFEYRRAFGEDKTPVKLETYAVTVSR